jgi:hypothetical protein
MPLGWRCSVAVALLLVVWACAPAAGPPLRSDRDLSAAPLEAEIGGPCAGDGDCQSGLCFVSSFGNAAGKVATPGGYCSKACASDSDCGNASCVAFGSVRYCLAACSAPADCRDGYACWLLGAAVCFPSENLTCDPAAGDGTCLTTEGKQGGCLRRALGTGPRGECSQACLVGADTCPFDQGPQICIVVNATAQTDGTPTGDRYRGTVCTPLSAPPGPRSDGAECLYPSAAGPMRHYADVCVDGDECYLLGGQPAGQGFDPRGDNLCHRLCNPPGFAGAALPCPIGLTCRDVFGLFFSGNPAGLCLP